MGNDDFYLELGRRVAARRASRRLTQLDVATALDISRASIANIEAGRQKLYVHQLYTLSRALGCKDLNELLPTRIPYDDTPTLSLGVEVSELQRAQLESMVRTAVASGKPAGRK